MKSYQLTLTIDDHSEAGRNIEALMHSQGMSREEAALELLSTDQIYNSPIMAAVHEMMLGVHQVGLLPDDKMREFDQSCLKPEFQSPIESNP